MDDDICTECGFDDHSHTDECQRHPLRVENKRLRDLLRIVADEPNIDRSRALADAALSGEGDG